MNYNPSDRATDVGGWSAHWGRQDVYDRYVSTAIHAAAMILCAAIYFELNRHVWFFDLLGMESNIKINLWFLVGLFLLVVIYRLPKLQAARSWAKTGMGARFLAALALYACFGGLSVALNEPGLDEVQSYLFYLYTPMLVMLSIVVLHPTDRTIRRTLVVLFVAALVFSAYSTILHVRTSLGEDLTALYPNAAQSDPRFLARKGIPGVGSNLFPSMLGPMVLTGLYFALKGARRVQLAAAAATAFLFFNVLITTSRGAILSLAVGLLYLGLRRWFHVNFKLILTGASLVAVFAVYGDVVVERFERSVLVQGFTEGVTGSPSTRADGYDDRLLVSLDSLVFYFAQHPIVGAGFTYHWESQGPRISGTDHNLYTQLLAEGGVFVGVPFALILFLIYRNAARMLRRCRHDREAVALGTILLAGFVVFLVNMNFTTGFIHYFAVWWGLLVAWTRNAHVRQLAGSYPASYAASYSVPPAARRVPLSAVSLRPVALGVARHRL